MDPTRVELESEPVFLYLITQSVTLALQLVLTGCQIRSDSFVTKLLPIKFESTPLRLKTKHARITLQARAQMNRGYPLRTRMQD
jgi:hypothetical protein